MGYRFFSDMNLVNSSLINLRGDVTEKCLIPIVFDLFTLVKIPGLV